MNYWLITEDFKVSRVWNSVILGRINAAYEDNVFGDIINYINDFASFYWFFLLNFLVIIFVVFLISFPSNHFSFSFSSFSVCLFLFVNIFFVFPSYFSPLVLTFLVSPPFIFRLFSSHRPTILISIIFIFQTLRTDFFLSYLLLSFLYPLSLITVDFLSILYSSRFFSNTLFFNNCSFSKLKWSLDSFCPFPVLRLLGFSEGALWIDMADYIVVRSHVPQDRSLKCFVVVFKFSKSQSLSGISCLHHDMTFLFTSTYPRSHGVKHKRHRTPHEIHEAEPVL